MPQVSVIIPTCNRAELLPVAIRSVLNQSFQDFELLVVDDAADDRAAEVVESFGDRRIHYTRHPHRRGGAAARNTGITRARGDYIAFLDDDDEWFADKLARQMTLMLESSPAVGAVYAGYLVVDKSSGRIRGQITPRKKGKLYPAILAENLVGGTSSVILRKSCLERVGGFDEKLPSFQDYDLWIRLARKFEFECIADPLLRYSVHERQVWTDLDALTRGLERMLQKYGADARFRRKSSGYFLSFGVRYCERNDCARARRALWRSARLYPYQIKPYVYLGASLLAAGHLDKIVQAKSKLLARARKTTLLPNFIRHA